MTLAAGSKLGPYEILSPLGAGGMGEVYRARDARLGRDVALKMLPPELGRDAERLARLDQEARSASALNHPNIVTIYEVGEADAISYIAMEYIQGRSLRDILSEGPVAPRRLLGYAAQIAEALARAHEAGIVHRDLKPENLMVTRDGYVKILDFGLAKVVAPASSEVSQLATAVGPTGPGVVLGTVGYMSP
ncbi:MAG TPA: serine/threonine-protein kinase, partial [Thermoanaerobaculia bacterium]